MIKRIISSLIVLTMVIGSGTIVFADTEHEKTQVSDITERVIDMSEIPENVGTFPYEFESEEEALAFVQGNSTLMESQMKNKEITVIERDSSTRGISWRFVSDYKPEGIWINDPNTGKPKKALIKFNVFADLKINWGPTAGILVEYRDAGVSLTGLTPGIDISDGRCFVDFTSNTRAKLTGRANLDYYLVVDGLLKMYSKPISYSWTYKTSR